MLERLVDRYVRDRRAKGELGKRAAIVARGHLLDFARSAHCDVEKLSRRHVDRWLASKPELQPSYRRARFYSLRMFCRWCVMNGYMAKDLTLEFSPPKVPVGLPRALHLDTAVSVASSGKDSRTRLIVSMMLQEGLRCCEVSRAQYQDIDHRKRALAVRGKGGGGSATRVLPISDETHVALMRYLGDHEVTGGYLIRSHRNVHCGISAQTVSLLVDEAIKAAGAKNYRGDGCSAHALRHTMAQDMLDSGAEPRQVQAALGHTSLRTTEIYLRNQVSGLRDAMTGRHYATGIG